MKRDAFKFARNKKTKIWDSLVGLRKIHIIAL